MKVAKNEGWIKWFRKAEHNDVLKDDTFDKLHAFMYLVEKANIEPVDIPMGNKTLHLERGQFHTSIKKLATIWGWSEGKTRRFLGALTGAHMIGISSNTNGSTVTIENYNRYQSTRRTNGSTNDSTNDSTGGRQRKKKERKDEKIPPKSAHPTAHSAEKKGGEPPMGEPLW